MSSHFDLLPEDVRYRRSVLGKRHYQSWLAGKRRAQKYGCIEICTRQEFLGWSRAHHADQCAICSNPSEQTDHIMPLAKGGTHTLANLQRLCSRCNARKCAWLPDEIPVWPWSKKAN